MKTANDYSIRPTNNPAKWMIVDNRTQRVVKFINAPSKA